MAISKFQQLTMMKMKLKGVYLRNEWSQIPKAAQEQLIAKNFVSVDPHSGNAFLTTLGKVAIRPSKG